MFSINFKARLIEILVLPAPVGAGRKKISAFMLLSILKSASKYISVLS
ncbi:hypothetical protein HGI62_09890 [Clostridium saccharobutylicum]|nr:hypothetical protein [Clostridium saccharobutylicum]MBC2514782.1 hypothetical protein [Clostridium saccharobutylicum]